MFKKMKASVCAVAVPVATLVSTAAHAAITAPTIDYDAMGTAVMGQVSTALPTGLQIFGILLGISVGIGLLSRLSRGKK